MKLDEGFITPGGALGGALFRDFSDSLSSPGPSLGIGSQIGPFRVLAFAGRGGMGEVYRAARVDADFDQQVALKVLRRDPLSRQLQGILKRERQILSRLEHPGIARLIDGGDSTDGQAWLALEWVDGNAVDRHCIDQRLGPQAVCELFVAIVEAVAYAHERLVLHGDLKPSNVLVDRRGRARLLDFGVSGLLDDPNQRPSAGYTPSVASPEQRAGKPLSVRSDVYQLGLLLRNLLDQARDLGLGQAEPTLYAIAAMAAREAPHARYASAGELLNELRAWKALRPVRATGGGIANALWLFLRRNRATALAAALATCLLLLLSLAYLRDLAAERALVQSEARRALQVTQFLTGLLHETDPRGGAESGTTIESLLERATLQLETESDLDLKLELSALLGEIYMVREDPARAQPLLRTALSLARERGAGAELQVRLRRHLAMAVLGLRATDEARQLLAEAMTYVDQTPDPLATRIDGLRNLALIEYYAGDLRKAIAVQQEAVGLAEQRFGTDAPELIVHLQNLGQYLGVSGDVAAGIPLLERGYRAALAAVGPKHPQTLNLGGALVQSLSHQGQHQRAADLLDEVHGNTIELWGAGSPNDALMWMARAGLSANRGDCSAAVPEYEQSLTYWRAMPPDNDLNSVGSLQGLGDCLVELGQPERALEVYREMLARNADGMHASDLNFGHRELRLAQVLITLKRCDEAQPLIDAASQRQKAVAAERHDLADEIEQARLACTDPQA